MLSVVCKVMAWVNDTSKATTALDRSIKGCFLALRRRLLLPGVALRDEFFDFASWKSAGGTTVVTTAASACSKAASAATVNACVRTSPAAVQGRSQGACTSACHHHMHGTSREASTATGRHAMTSLTTHSGCRVSIAWTVCSFLDVLGSRAQGNVRRCYAGHV